MPEARIDQASGLRRLFASAQAARLVLLAADEPTVGRAGALSLAEAFGRRGACAHVDDGSSEVGTGAAIRLFDDASRLGAYRMRPSRLVVLVHGPAGPAGLSTIYRSIKTLAGRHRVDHFGVLLDGVLDGPVHARCRANLAATVERFVGARIDFWASLGASGAFERAAREGRCVQSVDAVSGDAQAFDQLAAGLLDATESANRACAH